MDLPHHIRSWAFRKKASSLARSFPPRLFVCLFVQYHYSEILLQRGLGFFFEVGEWSLGKVELILLVLTGFNSVLCFPLEEKNEVQAKQV